MADEEIPSGKDTRVSQADGSVQAAERTAETTDQSFEVSATWNGDGQGSGRVRMSESSPAVPVAGATELGGAGGATNPEELLLSAIAACFVNTWAIFLSKLQIAYAEPAVRVTGTLGKDPAGGFQMTGAVVHARVPEAIATSDRARIDKSLALAEKYCIISKVARAAMTVRVEVEIV